MVMGSIPVEALVSFRALIVIAKKKMFHNWDDRNMIRIRVNEWKRDIIFNWFINA